MRRTPPFSRSWTPLTSWSSSLALGALLAVAACDGGSSSSDGGTGGLSDAGSGAPTAAQLKAACDSVFNRIISCSGAATTAGALAASYKAMTCTEANAQALATCVSASTLFKQSQACAAMECADATGCGVALVPSLQACVPDGGTGP